MPLSRSILRYEDCRAVLDTALARGGCIYSVPDELSPKGTWPRTVMWIMRANQYRKLLRTAEGKATAYDKLVIRADGNRIIIEDRPVELHQIFDLDGNPIEPDAPVDHSAMIAEFEAEGKKLFDDEP